MGDIIPSMLSTATDTTTTTTTTDDTPIQATASECAVANSGATSQAEEKSNNEWKANRGRYSSLQDLQNANFEQYYRRQNIISDEQEWQLFLQTLRRELPTSFRFNAANKVHDIYKQKLINDEFNLAKAERDGLVHDGLAFKQPYALAFYPHQNGWQCNFPKRYLNKHKDYFSAFRDFLVYCNENGIISRQETVSMVPPLFLYKYISPSDVVLDMCAAPGNKTAQLLEFLDYNLKGEWRTAPAPAPAPLAHTGFVLANDADAKRAHIMVHQLKRIGSNKFVVINKLAQCVPRMKSVDGSPVGVDNILCDVPCSSDGTLRKSPDLWRKWTISYGNGLHATQLAILIHALHLVKPGGVVVYSTCSFNPVENEAVICGALLKLNHFYSQCDANGETQVNVELVDTSNDLPHLRRNPGLTDWVVWNKKMSAGDAFYASLSDVPENQRRSYRESMFAPQRRAKCADIKDKVLPYLQLQRCMRFLPHFHDTGGFFVAVLRKKTAAVKTEAGAQVEEKKAESESSLLDGGMLNDAALASIEKREFTRKHVHNDNTPYYKMQRLPNLRTELQTIIDFYGFKLADDDDDVNACAAAEVTRVFDAHALYIRGLENPRSLWYVPRSIGELIGHTDNHQLRIVQSGCRAFVRHDTKVANHACKWRLSQDGCPFLSHLATKQVVTVELDVYLLYVFLATLEFEQFASLDQGRYAQVVETVWQAQIGGPCIVVLDDQDADVELNAAYKALSSWKCRKRIDLMIKRQDILLLQKHLKQIYKAQCKALNEKYDFVEIDVENDERRQHLVPAKKKKKDSKGQRFKKKVKKRTRDWDHRQNSNQAQQEQESKSTPLNDKQ
eukprot:CAMPEP_0202692574 /NCGR_PEP_ID=MMETSP1385-20130828/6914_1 /ASSEMBLY_ACC=CAM_ASM_000861 /TAXON_ID=933848 /ORGANISM="Elphidium margaritaceum" /LENGTH=841 /DNA_ID=CAMNT_0049348121 /DNA_START=128 /DNA_END=2653 /DNA_ORIENTATION=-